MSLEKVEATENLLLKRREVRVEFSAGAGAIKRRGAAEAVAKYLQLDSSKVFTIKLDGKAGSTKLRGTFYVYEGNEAKTNLPRHLYFRNRPEEKPTEKQKEKPKEAPKEKPKEAPKEKPKT